MQQALQDLTGELYDLNKNLQDFKQVFGNLTPLTASYAKLREPECPNPSQIEKRRKSQPLRDNLAFSNEDVIDEDRFHSVSKRAHLSPIDINLANELKTNEGLPQVTSLPLAIPTASSCYSDVSLCDPRSWPLISQLLHPSIPLTSSLVPVLLPSPVPSISPFNTTRAFSPTDPFSDIQESRQLSIPIEDEVDFELHDFYSQICPAKGYPHSRSKRVENLLFSVVVPIDVDAKPLEYNDRWLKRVTPIIGRLAVFADPHQRVLGHEMLRAWYSRDEDESP